jgi:predicted enzyme related to lactoylglutathione lyase
MNRNVHFELGAADPAHAVNFYPCGFAMGSAAVG